MATATKTAKKTKTRIRPLDDRLVIKRDDPEEVSEGGIILPDSAQGQQQVGTVLAVGPSKPWLQNVPNPGEMRDPAMGEWQGPRYPMPIKEGDRVLFGMYAPEPITIDDEEVIILRAEDILAVID